MEELLRTTDPVLISFVTCLLKDAGIEVLVADAHVSAVEGSIGAFPRRILVLATDLAESRNILAEAGLSEYLD